VERHPQVWIDLCTQEELTELLRTEGAMRSFDEKCLSEAYLLQIEAESEKTPMVTIKAGYPLGIYYGLISLCQLTNIDNQGKITVREGKILDWPETRLRLAKASATKHSHETLSSFADWLALFKMNVIGLQFHGENSKAPEKFIENIAAYTTTTQKKALVESIVYFSPFRGDRFDFRKTEDKKSYIQLLHQILDLGTNGIEVDYNDWGNETEVPIEDVLNLVATEMQKRVPEPMILLCPPQKGNFMYRGPASDEAARIFSLVPENIWPLWVGAPRFKDPTHPKFYNWTLTPELTEAWTKKTGRKPFLWINRVAVNTENSFSIELPGTPGAFVFNGLRLPVEMGKLFEGVHFNCDVQMMSDQTEMIYFATAADYLWNPHQWHPAESYRRALHFVNVMVPLMKKNESFHTAPKQVSN
jgi:hypothetical protein